MADRDLNIMDEIQEEKGREIDRDELQPLNAEGVALAEHKRETLDVVATPVDPLR